MKLWHFSKAAAGVLLAAGLLAGAEPPCTKSPETHLITRCWYEQPAPERTAEYVFGSFLGFPQLGQLWLEHPAAEHEPLAGRSTVGACGQTTPDARTYRVWVFESCQLRVPWTSDVAKERFNRAQIFEYGGGFFN